MNDRIYLVWDDTEPEPSINDQFPAKTLRRAVEGWCDCEEEKDRYCPQSD